MGGDSLGETVSEGHYRSCLTVPVSSMRGNLVFSYIRLALALALKKMKPHVAMSEGTIAVRQPCLWLLLLCFENKSRIQD